MNLLLKKSNLTGSMHKFTKNEFKVIKILLNNSLITDTDISLKLNISIQAVRKIRKKLENIIIRKYTTEFQYNSMGIGVLTIAIFKLLEEKYYRDIVNSLSPHVIGLYRVQKNPQTYVGLFAFQDMQELNGFFYKLSSDFYGIFKVEQIYPCAIQSILKYSEYQLINYILNCIMKNLNFDRIPARIFPKEYSIEKNELSKMKGNEMKVLGKLCLNGRVRLNKMAQELSLSPTAISKIQKRLEEKNIIKKYSIKVDYDKLGINIFSFVIAKEKMPLGNGIFEWVNKEPNVISCFKIVDGSTDILFCGFKDMDDLDHYFSSFQRINKDVLEIEDIYILTQKGIIYDSFDSFVTNSCS